MKEPTALVHPRLLAPPKGHDWGLWKIVPSLSSGIIESLTE